MKKVQEYIEKLKAVDNLEEYLKQESGLPGPRGNLELMHAVAVTVSEEKLLQLLGYTPDKAPVNSPEEFLAACGAMGLGRLAAEGKTDYLGSLRSFAADPRWRMREAVAMALQIFGEKHMEELIGVMNQWAQAGCYEKRAAAAALCEPKLLSDKEQVVKVLEILDRITESIAGIGDRRDEGFVALRKGMAYCWSVAIAYNFDEGRKIFEKWIGSTDKDIRWIIRENLKKDRLKRIDESWVQACLERN